MTPGRYWAWGAAILAAALGLRIACHVGVRTYEPIFTAHSAHEIVSGKYVPQKHVPGAVNNARLGMLLPTALAVGVAGLGDVSCTLWPMACGLLVVAGVLAFAPKVVRPEAALIAAALLAAIPVDVLYAGQLYSDLPMAVCWMLSAGLFWKALESGCRWAAAGSGLLVGLAWMMREPGVLFLAVLGAWTVGTGRWRSWLWACAGAGAVFAVECFGYAVTTGDPFFRLGIATSGVHARYMEKDYYQTAGAVARRVFLDLPSMMANPWDAQFRCTAGLPVAAALAGLARGREAWRDPVARRLVLWFGVVFLLFAAMPVSVAPWRPAMVLLARTLIPFSVPMALLLGWALAGRRWAVPAAAGLVAACLASLAWTAPAHLEAKTEEREALEALRREGATLILADDAIAAQGHRQNRITFLRGFDPKLSVYSLVDADPEIEAARGAYVMLNSANLERASYPPGRLKLLLEPPPSWRRIYYKEFARRGAEKPGFVGVWHVP